MSDQSQTREWPDGCQRPDRCESRRECSYHLTDNDHARERGGDFTSPCPHWNTIGIWEDRANGKWTPKTLMDACVHIRSLDSEIEQLRDANQRLRNVLQDVIDDMTFNVAPSRATMAKIKEAMQ